MMGQPPSTIASCLPMIALSWLLNVKCMFVLFAIVGPGDNLGAISVTSMEFVDKP